MSIPIENVCRRFFQSQDFKKYEITNEPTIKVNGMIRYGIVLDSIKNIVKSKYGYKNGAASIKGT
jgi:hypothetical protein